MSITTIGIIGICALLILFFLKMPVGFAMALVGFFGILMIRGVDSGLSNIALIPLRWSSTYVLGAIPLFILMGFFAANTGLTQDAFYAANKWIGHIRGGLAISTIGACAVFGAVCGDIIAAAVTMCSVALPEMRKYNYHDSLSLGCIAAGGNLSFLIPPSLGFITYAILTELSIGTLFIAGILPGLLMAVLFSITILIQCRLNPHLAAKGPKASWKERFASIRYVWGFGALILLVLGGIYGGVVTPTEAGALGVFGTVILGLANRRLSWHVVTDSFKSAAQLTGMILILIMGAMVFSSFMTTTEIPLDLANYIAGLALPPQVILAIILVTFVLIGFVLDIMAVIMLVVPILHPILVGLGFDPIWLGVLVIITVIMGHISPPFGVVVFSIGGVVRDVPIFTIFRGALPFLGAMFVGLVLIVIFPDIALILPHLMS